MTPGRKILVADDEESYRIILGDELRNAGYTVSLASDGAEAIKCLGREKIDLVLLDIKMPNVDGMGVMKYINEKHLTTKVIILTGFADLKIAMEAKEYGAIDFVNKPFSIEDVLNSVKQSLK